MKKRRILVADDERHLRKLLAEVLRLLNYDVDTVEDGLGALEEIHKRSYDLIITDYMMPGMNGLELTKKIKARYPSIPVLVITGNGPVATLLKSGASKCLRKPFDLFELKKTVNSLL